MTERQEPGALPCPFCGGPATVSFGEAYCGPCGVGAGEYGMSLTEWNRRTPDPLAEAREKVVEAAKQWRDADGYDRDDYALVKAVDALRAKAKNDEGGRR